MKSGSFLVKKHEKHAVDSAGMSPKDLNVHDIERTPVAGHNRVSHQDFETPPVSFGPHDLLTSASKLLTNQRLALPADQPDRAAIQTCDDGEPRPAEIPEPACGNPSQKMQIRVSDMDGAEELGSLLAEKPPKPPVGVAPKTSRRARPWTTAYSAARWLEADSSESGGTV